MYKRLQFVATPQHYLRCFQLALLQQKVHLCESKNDFVNFGTTDVFHFLVTFSATPSQQNRIAESARPFKLLTIAAPFPASCSRPQQTGYFCGHKNRWDTTGKCCRAYCVIQGSTRFASAKGRHLYLEQSFQGLLPSLCC